jgi:hypothetical protein
VASAWASLVSGAYNQDLSVQDGTGIPHLPGGDMSQWSGTTPSATLCSTWSAWGQMITAAKTIGTTGTCVCGAGACGLACSWWNVLLPGVPRVA